MSNPKIDEYVSVGSDMCQMLNDIIGDAEKAGCTDPFPDLVDTINQWEELYKRTDEKHK